MDVVVELVVAVGGSCVGVVVVVITAASVVGSGKSMRLPRYSFSARIGTFSEKARIGKLDEFFYQSCQNYCPLKPELLEFASSTSTFAKSLASITTAAKTFKP